MSTTGTLQEFIKQITKTLRDATPEVRADFREAWLAQVAERQRTRPPRYYVATQVGTEWAVARFTDRRFLRSVGVDPDGD
jgi:hypothetical protein